MFKNIWEWVLRLFGVKTQTMPKDMRDNDEFESEYRQIDEINFSAIFSNKLANYTINDSSFNITGENKRVDVLNEVIGSFWKKAKKSIGLAFGTGGIAVVPYVKSGKLYYSIVKQNRLTIDSMDGDKITGATLLSEVRDESNDMSNYRWTNYKIENGNLLITQKYTSNDGKEIYVPEYWADIQEVIGISNVDRVPMGFVKSPINNRKTNSLYGVPITYGCEATISEIKETLKQVAREYKLKEAFLGIDTTMFRKDEFGKEKLANNGLYKKFDTGKDDFFEIFDPTIRDSSYYARLQELYMRLEKEIGTSKGILSDPLTQNATATEIKRSMYDTFSIIDDMRSNIEDAMDDFVYGCNVLANAFSISPDGEYELSFDWDYSLVEDTQEQFNHLIIGVDKGVIDKKELRNWLKPDESLEESEKIVEEITAKTPSVKELVGE